VGAMIDRSITPSGVANATLDKHAPDGVGDFLAFHGSSGSPSFSGLTISMRTWRWRYSSPNRKVFRGRAADAGTKQHTTSDPFIVDGSITALQHERKKAPCHLCDDAEFKAMQPYTSARLSAAGMAYLLWRGPLEPD